MKTVVRTAFSLMNPAAVLFAFAMAWHNSQLTAYGQAPRLGVEITENGEMAFAVGEGEIPLRSLKEFLDSETFSRYPALIPGFLRLFGAAFSHWPAFLEWLTPLWEAFLRQLFW